MFIDEQDILISSGGGSELSRKYSKYLVDNIGVIHDATGGIDDTEREFGGISDSGASDREDWLVMDFQSHNLTASAIYSLYFDSIRFHIQINTEVAICADSSYALINSPMYPMRESFTFSALNATNLPLLGTPGYLDAYQVNGSNIASPARTYSTSFDTAVTSSLDTGANLYGVVLKTSIVRRNNGGAIDGTMYAKLLNDNIYIMVYNE